jgi:predicted outer membrane repeat protein
LALEALEDRCVPAVLTVNTCSDPATPPTSGSFLSLREAIQAVNGDPIPSVFELGQIAGTLMDNDTIVFDPTVFGETGTINLTAALPVIDKSVTILGPGPNQLTIDGGGKYQIFSIVLSQSAAGSYPNTGLSVSISGLRLANGNAGDFGGAIDAVGGNLTVNNCAFFANRAVRGGAIYVGGSATVTNSTFTSNAMVAGPGALKGTEEGGAIFAFGTLNALNDSFFSNGYNDPFYSYGKGGAIAYNGKAVVQNSEFNNNVASRGGALFAGQGGNLIASNDTFAANSAMYGGALSSGPFFNVAACTFADNTGTSEGGAIDATNDVQSGNIVASTFAGNTTESQGGALYVAANLTSGSAAVTLTNDTIAGNVGANGILPGGGGLYVESGANVILNNTIVAENIGSNLSITNNISGTVSGSNNLVDSPSYDGGLNPSNANLIGVPAALLPLGNYGGPTQTMPPAMSSQAIGGGNYAWDDPKQTDQRGFSISAGGSDPDIGAVATQPAGTPTHLSLQGPATANAASAMSWTATLLDDNNLPAANFAGPVLIRVASGPGDFTSFSTTSAPVVYGNAAFNNLVLDMPGRYTIQASFGNNTVTAPLVVTGGSIFMALSGQVTAGNIINPIFVNIGNTGQTISGPVTLTLLQNNVPVPWSSNGQPTVTVLGQNAVAKFTGLVENIAGQYQLKASEGDLSASLTFVVIAGVPAQVVFLQQPTSATLSKPISPAVVVGFEDALGNITTASGSVTMTVASGPGKFVAGSTTTVNAVSGKATFANLMLASAGTYTLKAKYNSGNFSTLSNSFSVGGGDPVVGPSQCATVKTNFTTQLFARVTTAWGAPIPGTTVTFTAPGSGPGGTFAGRFTAAVLTDANGVATAPAFKANGHAGSFNVTVGFKGIAPPETIPMTNLAGAPVHLKVVGPAAAPTIVNSAFATLPAVLITDSFGNPVAGVNVTFTAPASGPGGTFAGQPTATAVTDAQGRATAPPLIANASTGTFRLLVSVLHVPSATIALINLPGSSVTALPYTGELP